MEGGKIHTRQVEIEFSNLVGVLMQRVEIPTLDLFGLIQEQVGIMLQYAHVLKLHAVVVTTG